MALLAGSIASAQPKRGKMETRHVFIRVVDQQGAPVAGLAAADFNLGEGFSDRRGHRPAGGASRRASSKKLNTTVI
jgi:hypothetical protein